MFQQINYETRADQLSAKHKGLMVSVVWEDVVSAHGVATA